MNSRPVLQYSSEKDKSSRDGVLTKFLKCMYAHIWYQTYNDGNVTTITAELLIMLIWPPYSSSYIMS